MYTYKPRGTCSTLITIETDGTKLKTVKFENGCRGNLNAIGRLVAGMEIDDVIKTLEGTPCQGKTSCPDQLAQALKQLKAGQLKNE